MIRPIINKTEFPLHIIHKGTASEKMSYAQKLAQTLCSYADEFMGKKPTGQVFAKKEVQKFFSTVLPGININIKKHPHVSTEYASTSISKNRFILRFTPPKARNLKELGESFFNKRYIANTPNDKLALKHESAHLILFAVNGLKIKKLPIKTTERLTEFKSLVMRRLHRGIFGYQDFQNAVGEFFEKHNYGDYDRIQLLKGLRIFVKQEKFAYTIQECTANTTKGKLKNIAKEVESKYSFDMKELVLKNELKNAIKNYRIKLREKQS